MNGKYDTDLLVNVNRDDGGVSRQAERERREPGNVRLRTGGGAAGHGPDFGLHPRGGTARGPEPGNAPAALLGRDGPHSFEHGRPRER